MGVSKGRETSREEGISYIHCETHQTLLNIIQVLWTLSNWEPDEKVYLIFRSSIISQKMCGPRIMYTKAINPDRARGMVMMKEPPEFTRQGPGCRTICNAQGWSHSSYLRRLKQNENPDCYSINQDRTSLFYI